jgi:dienelactone hydrolase
MNDHPSRAPRRRRVTTVALTALVPALLAGPAAVAAGPSTDVATAPAGYTGTIDGAAFRVEVPADWNGTLVLFSHPYYAEGMPEFPIGFATRVETETWLLDHGYALAASDFQGRTGFVVEQAIRDDMALLDWFTDNVGAPARTISTGASMGASIAILLAEQHPDRIDGVIAECGPLDQSGTWNTLLDVSFAIATLLVPDQNVDLVRPADPAGSTAALQRAVDDALDTPEGRARLALANAFGNVVGWGSAHEPQPTDLVERIRQQAALDRDVIIGTFGPTARGDLERRAGGNPSSNVGIDYRHQLARSDQQDAVREAYRIAGLDLDRDLDLLAAASRIEADPGAVDYLVRHADPQGTTPAPVLTLHNTGDGGAVPDHERWYAGQVRRSGNPEDLRQLFVDRGTHCAFSASEEIVALQALLDRLDTGRWPDTSPHRMNAAAGAFDAAWHMVFDFATFTDAARRPGFVSFAPPASLRPSS